MILLYDLLNDYGETSRILYGITLVDFMWNDPYVFQLIEEFSVSGMQFNQGPAFPGIHPMGHMMMPPMFPAPVVQGTGFFNNSAIILEGRP